MVSQSQEVVLVDSPVVSFVQDAPVGQVLQVLPDFPFPQPGKGVEPAEGAGQFPYQHVDGVCLAGVGLLMGQYLVQFPGGMPAGTDEYPVEERERRLAFGQDPHRRSVHFCPGAAVVQADDGQQLDPDAPQQQADAGPVEPRGQGQDTGCGRGPFRRDHELGQ